MTGNRLPSQLPRLEAAGGCLRSPLGLRVVGRQSLWRRRTGARGRAFRVLPNFLSALGVDPRDRAQLHSRGRNPRPTTSASSSDTTSGSAASEATAPSSARRSSSMRSRTRSSASRRPALHSLSDRSYGHRSPSTLKTAGRRTSRYLSVIGRPRPRQDHRRCRVRRWRLSANGSRSSIPKRTAATARG